MKKASAAVLLVSADFLTSKFILGEEVPKLLERREKEGLRIFPVIIRPCSWKQVKWLSRMNLRPRDGKPLMGGNEFQIETDLAAIAEEIAGIVGHATEISKEGRYLPLPPERISLAKLPSTNPELFGREKELKLLDDAWVNPKTNIVCFVAWGGVGKTALVNSWLGRMRAENFRGAERVFGWSFYSQGASEGKQASADVFIASALRWFGDPEPEKGTPWEKGERLAEYVKKQKTLLILDGIEPLQAPSHEPGKIKDPALSTLVRELAHDNPGLCIITTRMDVDDIKDFIGNAVENQHLEHLSDEAGMELLKHLDVKGTDDEIKQAVRDFGGHALALTLLGTYLSKVYKGDVRKRDRIAKLTKEEKYGGRAIQVMESYEVWFKGKPELDILRLMGLFDSPAEGGAIEVLRADPPIKGLTSQLKKLSDDDWCFALDNLRKAGLLAREDPNEPDTLDCHPLIREHFGEKLKNSPESWKEAHGRLYEYYKTQSKEYPDTIEEMLPLYKAVAHGCRGGRNQKAFKEVFRKRIQRNEAFSWRKLGIFGADLSALSGLFDEPWSLPAAELKEDSKAFILNEVGLDLRALGRLKEATQPMKAGLDAYIAQENLKSAARTASNLSELFLTMGDLAQALDHAKQSVEFADKSGDAFERMGTRTTLANTLHQAGTLAEAETLFQEAEKIQKKDQPEYPLLYSLQGFQYCDLLLGRGKYKEVLSRAEQTLQWAKTGGGSLLSVALEHLSLGRVHLLQALHEGTGDLSKASEHLNQAVNWLHRAGTQHHIPRGLLARSKLYIAQKDFKKSRHDLDEAMTIAERGEMGLHKADCRLGYTRLYLALGEKKKAREEMAIAKEMIGKMGYHRRDGEVKELDGRLKL
ncbi:MAG: tetratricopeptide repeat protein [Candidatus Methanoperedens sp.]|nr:tetratricopeptide repeat protein [Candidatus Methanoperedens sp.]